MSHNVVVFGEMLWDCLPSGDIPGGAPMNVALNLHQLGLEVQLISAVGKDEDGQKLLQFLKSFSLPTNLIQVKSEHPTSKVLVDDSDAENIKYTIVSPVAWDYILWNENIAQAIADAEALVFGTLALRNRESLATLLQLLHQDILKIFDVNIRAPFYDFEVIETLLGFADILKINEDELEMFASYYHLENKVEIVCEYLDQHFPMDMICVTFGSKGAMIYKKGKIISHQGYKVIVSDTIGAGDAFLSGIIKGYLEGKSSEDTLDFACKLGAFVAGKKGGTPRYELSDVG
jgi:fructokinase